MASTAPLSDAHSEQTPSHDSTHPLPVQATLDSGERRVRSGRHSRFSPEQDLIIVREVAAAGTHVAQYGQTRALYEKKAQKCNENRNMSSAVTWKQVQGRYVQLQTLFDKDERIAHVRSGLGGGALSELNELLSQMREARDDQRNKKNSEKEKVARDEGDKERIGRYIIAASTSRKRKLKPDYRSNDESGSDSGSPSVKVRPKKRRTSVMRGELAAFGEHLKDSDMARIAFEREQLAFEREKYAAERVEREKEREDRRAEREAASQLELEKLKVMMCAFTKNKE